MIEAAIARRYSKALLDLAKEQNALDAFSTQVETLDVLMNQNVDLHRTLTNRFLDLNARYKIVDEVGSKLSLNREVIHFVKLLIKKGRIGLFSEIARAFKEFSNQAQNKVDVIVTSAKPLSEGLYQAIQADIARKMNKEVILEKITDESVLGGVSVRIANEIYDGTVKADLQRMKEKMLKTALA